MGKHSRTAGSRTTAIAAGAAVAALGAAGAIGAYAIGRPDHPASALGGPACGARTAVTVVVAPEMQELVQKAAGRAAANGSCTDYVLRTAPGQVAAQDAAGGTDGAQLWVTDSPVWAQLVAKHDGAALRRTSPSLATSPIVIGLTGSLVQSGKAPVGAISVKDITDPRLPVVVGDVDFHSPSLLGITALTAAGERDPRVAQEIRRTFVQLSQSWMSSEQLAAKARVNAPIAFPASEQELAALSKAHPATPFGAAVPREGTTSLDYRLVELGGSQAAPAKAYDALLAQLTSAAGKEELKAAGFRVVGSAGPQVKGLAGQKLTTVPLAADLVDSVHRSLDAVALRQKLLVALDTTGSMASTDGGSASRIQQASGAVATAVKAFPPSMKVGLWTFAEDAGGPGRPTREVVPVRPLQQALLGKTQADVIQGGLAQLALARPTGGTPLYDTVLSTYRAALDGYENGMSNVVVVVTDGRNEDAAGPTLEKTLSELHGMTDASRPVKVVLVGIGKEPDMAVLRRIAAATDGVAYSAPNAQDVGGVVLDALADRITAPSAG